MNEDISVNDLRQTMRDLSSALRVSSALILVSSALEDLTYAKWGNTGKVQLLQIIQHNRGSFLCHPHVGGI